MIKCYVINLDHRKDRLKKIKRHLNSNGLKFIRFKAVNALETLLDKSVEIVLVSPNKSDIGEEGWQQSLLKKANYNNLPVKQFYQIKHESSIKYLKTLQLDFIFSIQYDQIILRN